MEIRRAGGEEASEIAEMWLRSREAAVPAIPPPVHPPDEVHAWFQTVVLATKEVWIAKEGGAVRALLVLDDDWIDQLYVAPGHAGRGLGSELVNLAKARRPRGLQLWTFQANRRAQRFYKRHGFVPRETTTGDNEEKAPDVRYEWRPS